MNRTPAWSLVVGAMVSVQLGSALSTALIDQVGAAGTAWLRLTFGALIFIAIGRPRLRSIRRRDVPPLLGLGIASGLSTTCFLAAIERIPLGTAVAIEFLGPLTVAAVRSEDRRSLVQPGLALAGVLMLTEPWSGLVDLGGVGLAALAALAWAVYVLLTQHVGDRFTGLQALSITVPVAAIATAALGLPQAVGHLTAGALIAAAGLAILLPVLPYALEMLALRRMRVTAFGTLLALEPAVAVLLGLVLLHQIPDPLQIVGLTGVVVAGVAAQRPGRARPQADSAFPARQ